MKKIIAVGLLLMSNGYYFAQDNENNGKNIEEVVISKKRKKKKKYVNPAHEILEKLVAKKEKNNPEKLKSYSSENHTRLEVAMNNLGNIFQKRQLYKDLNNIMQSSKETLGEENVVLPVFISENIADYYYQKSPAKVAEYIKKSKIEGVGVEDNALFSQLMSSTFIRYNFYNNYIRVLDKDFISPLNDNFALQYDYELVDRDFVENDRGYYKINFKPKRESDLAFEGTLLIDHGTYSLYKIEAKITPNANINFVNNVTIEQELEELEDTEIHMPIKSRIVLETASLGKNGMSGVLKYYVSSKNFELDKDFDENIFKKSITFLPNALKKDDDYWEKNRHEPLTAHDIKLYEMIDDVRNLPSIKSYLEIIDIAMKGYYNVGKIDIGPLLYTAGYNDIEGFRMRFGARTSNKFSDKWVLGGYIGYGFKDKEPKFGGYIDYIISRDPWTQAGISASHDLGQVALRYGNSFIREEGLFDAFSKNGRMSIRRPFSENEYKAYFQIDILNSLRQKVVFKHSTFNPILDFSYIDEQGNLLNKYKISEIMWETQWEPGKKTIQSNRNQQIVINDSFFAPIVTFRFTHGFKDMFGGNFEYNKFHLNVRQSIPMGILGRGQYSITAGYIPDRVPYPLLENHLGNEFFTYNNYAFNMMRFFEFTSNKYASIQYTQNLEGLITNRLPLIKKLNWRNHLTFNYLIGDLEEKFQDGILEDLGKKPYIEIGYGFSNILRFLRIDFTHRLTHLNNDNPRFETKLSKFGVKISAQIRL